MMHSMRIIFNIIINNYDKYIIIKHECIINSLCRLHKSDCFKWDPGQNLKLKN